MRLDKRVTLAGLTRSQARKAIASGRVRVGGEVCADAARAVDMSARVELDGSAVSGDASAHIMLYKPAGVITATSDARERTVLDLLPDEIKTRGVGAVGRLDKDATGLIILTSDGQLTHRLISPKRDIDKVYLATVRGRLDDECARAFEAGVRLKDFACKPAKLIVLSAGDDVSECEVRITEGKYHQVKRMLLALNHEVIALHRKSIAGVTLDSALKPGEWRWLTDGEIEYLYRIAELEHS